MTAAAASTQYARVAVDRGLDRYPDGLTYKITSEQLAVRPGHRVTVPLGRSNAQTSGIVVAVGGEELLDKGMAPDRVKAILQVHQEIDPLPESVLRLAHWISSYYCAPIGVTIAGVTPSAVRKGIGRTTRLAVDLAQTMPGDPEKLHTKRRAVLAVVSRLPVEQRPVDIDALRAACGIATRAPILALIKSGHLQVTHRTTVQAKWRSPTLEDARIPEPTADQRRVIESVSSILEKGFSQQLLHGVTGSGKTEVYLRLAARVLDAGKSVLYLVPEISLTPQTGGRIVSRLPKHRMAILHSGLSAAQRHEQWLVASQPGPKIVIGARSAVFAPIPDGELGLIVVDEEHDHSYKQDQSPRYHGRDVAIRRAQLCGCPILLGSATPSLESWYNATKRGVSTLHRLPDRAPGLTTPRVEIVDFRKETVLRRDRRVHLLGPTLEVALRECFAANAQAIILLNRRGYANWIACPDHECGWMMQCDHCEAGMVVHHDRSSGKRIEFARCHHCQAQQKVPSRCPRCANAVTIFGLGTQRVEEELARLFPELAARGKVARVDSDSMALASDFHDVLGRFARGEIQLLLGTQMIAKGLDFPNVRVVGVISADTALNLPDFRASERTYQLVSQVSGRCGRGERPGRAIIQTFQPDADPILAAARQDYEGFAQRELAIREQFGLPPVHRMARIVVRHADRSEAERIAAKLRRELAVLPAAQGVVIREPAPCPIARISDRWRIQIELNSETSARLQQLIASARSANILSSGELLAIDVDPVALL